MSERALLRRQVANIEYRTVDEKLREFVFQSEDQARDSHVIRTAGVRTQDFAKNPVIPWCHVYRPTNGYSGLPVARAVGVRKFPEEGKSRLRAVFAGEEQSYPFAATVDAMLRDGFLNMTSYGWETVRAVPLRAGIRLPSGAETVAIPGALDILESNMLEASIVLIGSDKNALYERARRDLPQPIAEQFVAEIERGETEFANQLRMADAPAEVRHLASSTFTGDATEDRGWGEWSDPAPYEVRGTDEPVTETRAIDVETTLLDVVQRLTALEAYVEACKAEDAAEDASEPEDAAPSVPDMPPGLDVYGALGAMSAKVDEVRGELKSEIASAFADVIEAIHTSRDTARDPVRAVEEAPPPAPPAAPAPAARPEPLEARFARVAERVLDRRRGIVRT